MTQTELIARLERIKLELRGTTAQGGDAECLIDGLLRDLSQPVLGVGPRPAS